MASPDNGAKGSGDGGDGEEFRELSEFLGHQRMQYDELRHVYEAKKKMLSEIEKECRHLENFEPFRSKLCFENQQKLSGFPEVRLQKGHTFSLLLRHLPRAVDS